MAGDDIHAMSETLAADPSSLVFLPLAESLLARGDLARALRVAQKGALRHAGRADAHDLVARIALASGDEPRAEEAWATVLGIDPEFGTAHRGIGFLRYRQGRLDEAKEHLAYAAYQDPADTTVRTALDAVLGVIAQRDAAAQPDPLAAELAAAEPRSGPSGRTSAGAAPGPEAHGAAGEARADAFGDSPARLFDPILDDSKVVALLLDADGLVTAGEYVTAEGRDLGAEIGAHLIGVGEEADRAMRHFKLGMWTQIVIETDAATVAMSHYEASAVLIAAPVEVPLGFVRRTLERCLAVSKRWLEAAR